MRDWIPSTAGIISFCTGRTAVITGSGMSKGKLTVDDSAAKSEEIVFVRGTTEAINMVAYAWGGKYLRPGDEIVISHLEHNANIVLWQLL